MHNLTTDQLYSIGYGDGLAERQSDRLSSLFQVPTAKESPLENGWADELLNQGAAS